MKYAIVTDSNGRSVRVKVSARVGEVIEKFDRLEQKHEQELSGSWIIRLDEQSSERPPRSLQLPSAEDVFFDLLCQEIREQNVNNSGTLKEHPPGGIQRVLNTCTPLQKERFLLYIKENMTMEQIAEMQGCNRSSVHRSIKKVMELIAKSL